MLSFTAPSFRNPNMSSSITQNLSTDEQSTLLSLYWRCGSVLDTVFRTAIDLNLFDIISKAGGADDEYISAADIASHVPTKNEQAPDIIDRMLHLLASHSVVKSTVVYDQNGRATRLYGMNSVSLSLLPDEEGISRAPKLAYFNDRAILDPWKYMKEAILEGGSPFQKANGGMGLFQCLGKDSKLREAFDDAMHAMATNFMRDILQSYTGFEDIDELVDIGGGDGVTLHMIISKCPHTKGINFDLPQVIKNAPTLPGIEHVEGDMFKAIPKAGAMMIKRVLHNWSDEKCVKLLNNCLEALPEHGKVIVIDMILPESAEADISSRIALSVNMTMFTVSPGGKERTQKEFEALGKAAGFAATKVACRTPEMCVLEFYKCI